MTDQRPNDDEDLLLAVAHALRYDGKRAARSAEKFMAEITAERILAAIRRGYVITKKSPQPLAPASSLPRMGPRPDEDLA